MPFSVRAFLSAVNTRSCARSVSARLGVVRAAGARLFGVLDVPAAVRARRDGTDTPATDLVDGAPAREARAGGLRIDGLRVPTLLVRGRHSDLLSEEGARDFLARVPHAEFADVAGAGHMVAGDRNEIFNRAILRFLERHR